MMALLPIESTELETRLKKVMDITAGKLAMIVCISLDKFISFHKK